MRLFTVAVASILTFVHRNLHYSVLDIANGHDNLWRALECEFPVDIPEGVPYALRTVVVGGYVFTSLQYDEDIRCRSFPTSIATGKVVRVSLFTPCTTQ